MKELEAGVKLSAWTLRPVTLSHWPSEFVRALLCSSESNAARPFQLVVLSTPHAECCSSVQA